LLHVLADVAEGAWVSWHALQVAWPLGPVGATLSPWQDAQSRACSFSNWCGA
jgi:hypothetical protein